MSKVYSDAELCQKANEQFDKDKALQKVYATSDGNIFLERNKNHAVNHARENKLHLKEIGRAEESVTPIEQKLEEMSVKDLKAMCDGRGIVYTSKSTKAELVQLIQDNVLDTENEIKED